VVLPPLSLTGVRQTLHSAAFCTLSSEAFSLATTSRSCQPQTTMVNHRSSRSTTDHHGQPQTTMVNHRPPWPTTVATTDHHGQPQTTMVNHRPPWSTTDHHGQPQTSLHLHRPSANPRRCATADTWTHIQTAQMISHSTHNHTVKILTDVSLHCVLAV